MDNGESKRIPFAKAVVLAIGSIHLVSILVFYVSGDNYVQSSHMLYSTWGLVTSVFFFPKYTKLILFLLSLIHI